MNSCSWLILQRASIINHQLREILVLVATNQFGIFMNFSKINYQSLPGKILRLPLRLIPKRMVLPILQGRMRGKKWIVGAGEHGYWLGSYEMSKRLAFEREINPGSIVYDIGANVGYFSLLASVLVGEKGKVFAFEPLPRNIEFLKKHISLNKLTNIEVIEAAVSSQSGEAFFDLGASTAMGHLSDSGKLQVQMVCLDDLVSAGEVTAPDYIKLDVEGAEYDALRGAEAVIDKFHPLLFLDTHQRSAHQNTIGFLEQKNYRFEILDGKTLAETKELIARPEK
jgi:FkbM family methyltransferase